MDRREFLHKLLIATGSSIAVATLPTVWAHSKAKDLTAFSKLKPFRPLVKQIIGLLCPIPDFVQDKDIDLFAFTENMVVVGFSEEKQNLLIEGLSKLEHELQNNPIDVLVESAFAEHESVIESDTGKLTNDALVKENLLLTTLLMIRDVSLIGLFSHASVAPLFTDDLYHAGQYEPCINPDDKSN